MNKKALVLMGSPRKNANTDRLSDEFIRGAVEAENHVVKVNIREKNISGCLGCNTCQRNGGNCIQKDDMVKIYKYILESDVIVLASPVYFFTWTSQIKAVLDRLYALEGTLSNKMFYMLSTGMAPEEKYMNTMIESYQNYVSCFGNNNKDGGYLFGFGTDKPSDIIDNIAMSSAYDMGKEI